MYFLRTILFLIPLFFYFYIYILFTYNIISYFSRIRVLPQCYMQLCTVNTLFSYLPNLTVLQLAFLVHEYMFY